MSISTKNLAPTIQNMYGDLVCKDLVARQIHKENRNDTTGIQFLEQESKGFANDFASQSQPQIRQVYHFSRMDLHLLTKSTTQVNILRDGPFRTWPTCATPRFFVGSFGYHVNGAISPCAQFPNNSLSTEVIGFIWACI